MKVKQKPIQVGVIGASGVGQLHLHELKKLAAMSEVAIIAVADNNEAHAISASQMYSCDYHLDYRDLLARKDIQLVHICAPSGLHAGMALEAAHHNKHVIVEKPMDISLSKAEGMNKAFRKNNLVLSVIMQNRFARDVQRVKKGLTNGLLGMPLLVNASVHWFRSQEYFDRSIWRGTWNVDGGGAVMNQGIHTVDLLLYLMGDYEKMQGSIATLAHERIEVEDTATAAIRFDSGALGVFSSTTSAYPGFHVRIEIFGLNGSLILEDNQLIYWKHRQGTELSEIPSYEKLNQFNDHGRQFYDVIQALRENRDPDVTGEEGIKSLKLVNELYSSRLRYPV